MGKNLGLIIGCLFVLTPAIALSLALIGDAVVPQDIPADELPEEVLARWGTLLKWALILRHISMMPLFFGTGMIALFNWHNGYATWTTWTCIILGCIASFLLMPAAFFVPLLVAIVANTSSWLAPWK